MLSVFDLFSVGVGPSSSHTGGPMIAACDFADALIPDLERVHRVTVDLYGSLGATGKGHRTDMAVLVGLGGNRPDSLDPAQIDRVLDRVRRDHRLELGGRRTIEFVEERDLGWHGETVLAFHPNGMRCVAYDSTGEIILRRTSYSVGGGFVVDDPADAKIDRDAELATVVGDDVEVPYPFRTGAELLAICDNTGLSIARVMRDNETARRSSDQVTADLLDIWSVMTRCVQRGLDTEGLLPGGLRVTRRAPRLATRLALEAATNDPLRGMDWLTLYALAVNEENAAGGQVVTAPTNGAAGVIPAVLHYYQGFIPGADDAGVVRFLLTAGAIGVIVKENASISGAEVGCQGEVGSACSMAAAGLAAVLGGTPRQVENAAEIGMEHNLGLTCDPIAGLVQVPCIERNAIAAVKAVAAARAALRGDGHHLVSLDTVLATMRATGADMHDKYKETSRGGLAVSAVEC
ncbi:MAG: L-serine ammonia-lyase [Ilumatobacter coccineus]|uniref:L-serine dehydratase n=1 Tax=Ilumatobacter coccineus TaxID=467094 RepID=A0A2G6K7I7_9ACTN|nr:MAG: L-serine ammonia-lyase [Ilumatobacter coccineus]